ncbi:MAG: D-alanine--D-alanine ligase family protein [Bacteroidota bacterium]
MKIGITYDLRSDYLKMGYTEEETAEFDKEDTIIAIEETLASFGFETERIGHILALTEQLAAGKRWDLVFNISEGLYGTGREAQVPALLDAWKIPYVFSGPLVLALTLDKGMTKHVIRDVGVPTADFAVVRELEDAASVNLPFPLFAKPVAEGTGKGIHAASVIRNKEELRERCAELLEKFKQPVLVETYLSGREFTVGITGTGKKARSVGVMEILLNEHAEQGVYSYFNKDNFVGRVEYVLADGPVAAECEKVSLDAWRALGCEDGGRVDVRFDSKGICNFIEVNPLAGLNPIISDLPILCGKNGISYRRLLRMIMVSALEKNSIQFKMKD